MGEGGEGVMRAADARLQDGIGTQGQIGGVFLTYDVAYKYFKLLSVFFILSFNYRSPHRRSYSRKTTRRLGD